MFVVLCLPLVYIFLYAFQNSTTKINIWENIYNTLFILLVVVCVSMLIGASLAWFVSMYQFKGKVFLQILFALPLAFPPYIMANIYSDFLYYQGLFPAFLKLFNIHQHFDISNIYGAIFVYIITLYPYVYLTCLSYFKQFNTALVESAQTLQKSAFQIFVKVGLSLAYVPMLTGSVLVAMEVISDFGVVEYYGVKVFSTAIFKLWMNYSDSVAAIRLACFALIFVFIVVYLFTYLKKGKVYYITGKSNRKHYLKPHKLHFVGISIFLAITLIVPCVQLIYQAHFVFLSLLNVETFYLIIQTIYSCGIAALICVFIAWTIAKEQQFQSIKITKWMLVGYAIPGIIIALMIVFLLRDIEYFLLQWHMISSRILTYSVVGLFFGYVIRFLGIAFQSMQAGYQKINPQLYQASQTLQKGKKYQFFKIDLPLMKNTCIYSFLLVFLEILKELPITLMLKPFKFETLTSYVSKYAYNEQSQYAAFYSLWIVAIAMLFVTILMYQKGKKDARD